MKELIILDIDETIIGGGKNGLPYVKRHGLEEFIEKNKDATLVAFTAAGMRGKGPIRAVKDKYLSVLSEFNILEHLSDCYFGWDTLNKHKDIGRVAKDYKVSLDQVVMIGDSPIDERSADFYGVDFKKVPRITDEIRESKKRSGKGLNPNSFVSDYESLSNPYSFSNLEL